VTNRLKAGKTRSEIELHSKEMTRELIRHQRYFIDVKASMFYLVKIRILEKAMMAKS